jgi:tetratricopeptide (TPR) repeat protein
LLQRPRFGAFVLALLAVPLSPRVFALEARDEVCASVQAYAFKLDRGERRKREEEAKREALDKLARRLWSDSFPENPGPSTDPDRTFALLRAAYGVDELLAEGVWVATGDKNKKEIEYCVPADAYAKAKRAIREQRERTVETLRKDLANLERMVHDGWNEAASEALTELELRVVGEGLGQASYQSPIDGRTRPFYVWLLEWGDIVVKGPEFVEAMTRRAQQLIETGNVDAADRYLSEALKADRDDARAQELRFWIQELRIERAALLREAKELAEAARFKAAERELEEAAALSGDDPQVLEEAARVVAGYQAAFLEYNRPVRGEVFVTFGNLAVDTGEVEKRVSEATGLPISATTPMNIGGGATFAVARNVNVGVTGSFGFSQDEFHTRGGNTVTLYDVAQLTGSVGYRTLRSATKDHRFRVDGGVAWEWARADPLLPTDLDESDSQLGFFVRFSMEWKNTLVYFQHGFGFDVTTDSLIGFSNNLQMGIGGVFP